MNKVKKILLLISLSVVVFSGVGNVYAIELSAYEDEVDLLIKEDIELGEISEEIKNLNTDIKIKEYPEIGLMHLDFPEDVSLNDIVHNKKIKASIEDYGNLPTMQQEKMDLGKLFDEGLMIHKSETFVLQSNLEELKLELFDAMAWHVDEVTNNRQAMEISKGKGVRIALIDTGVDPNHPVLHNNLDLENSMSFIENDLSINDINGHGTMVAGIICQIAPDAIITPYRVIGASSGECLWTINAIIKAVDDGNDIINASIGVYLCKDIKSEKLTIKAFERAIKYAEKNDVMVIAASGNSGLDSKETFKTSHIMHLPGDINNVIAVSSVNNKQLTTYSNYGPNIKFCAPGGDLAFTDDGYVDLSQWIYCLYPTSADNMLSAIGVPQGYTLSYGTSLSAPAVTAGLADVLSYYREDKIDGKKIKSKDIINILAKSAIDFGEKGYDIYYGYGKIDIYSALVSIKNKK